MRGERSFLAPASPQHQAQLLLSQQPAKKGKSLPRKKGDFIENDDIYDKLEHHDADMTSGRSRLRSREDRASEATMMREHF